MITVVDTNILLDVFGADSKFGQASSQLLRRCLREGSVHASEIVWVETATSFSSADLFRNAISLLSIEFSPITEETALTAAQSWRKYRQSGGKRERVAADFLIGAHAFVQGDRLLTRDRGFYRKYFKSLEILDPTS